MDSMSTHAHSSHQAMPQQYIWNTNSASKFSTYFTNVDVSRKLLEFNRSCTNSKGVDRGRGYGGGGCVIGGGGCGIGGGGCGIGGGGGGKRG